jgi:phosphoglycolate phosphatase
MSNIIFDFDGTIADSFATVIDIFYALTDPGKAQLPGDEIERLRGMSLLQVAKELKVEPWRIPFLVARGRQRMRSQMKSMNVIKDMPEVIRQLSAAGHHLYIMSSNSVQNIEIFVEKHELGSNFIKLYGGVGLLSKAMVLKKIMRQNKLKTPETYYIGDEVRDIEGAKRAGLQMISVTWGYNNETVLAAHQPDYLVRKPREILKHFR